MRHAWRRLREAVLVLTLLPACLLAAGKGGARIVIVADSRALPTWKAWWTNLYNESHLWFALLTILIVPSAGFILGKLTDWLLARTGVNLETRELAEH